MKKSNFLIIICLLIFCVGNAQYTVLHDFNGGRAMGPNSSLTLSGGVLFGTTPNNIFSINLDGSGYTNLHTFTGPDGSNVYSTLTVVGSTLFGVASTGGATGKNAGTIFSIQTNGSGFTTLYTFDSLSGANAIGELAVSGNVLYGSCRAGGLNNKGTIYSINISGTNFQKLLDFDGVNGADPGSLTLSGNALYGTAGSGGLNNFGVVYSIHTDGTNFIKLLDFNNTNGSSPVDKLLLSGTTLYGVCYGGGHDLNGIIYSMHTDGTNYATLYSFSYGSTAYPAGGLTIYNSVLYGLTYGASGANALGMIYSINTNGTNFTDIHDFDGTNGNNGSCGLVFSGNTMYGATSAGGTGYSGNPNTGDGVIFSFVPLTTAIKPNLENGTGMMIYPNPSKSNFTISCQLPSASGCILTICDSNGKAIYTDKTCEIIQQYNKVVDLSDQPKGVYYVEIISGKERMNKRIEIQ